VEHGSTTEHRGGARHTTRLQPSPPIFTTVATSIVLLIMALPKLMRLIAGATVLIMCFMLLQILRAPAQIDLPTSGSKPTKLKEWDHDPQLDRKFDIISKSFPVLIVYTDGQQNSIRRTARPAPPRRGQQLRPRQSEFRSHPRNPDGAGPQFRAGTNVVVDAGPGADMEPQVQLSLDLLQRRGFHRGIQEEGQGGDQSRSQIRYVSHNALDILKVNKQH